MQQRAGIALISSSAMPTLVSFHPDILRDGNQAIASMLAVVGILGLLAGWNFRQAEIPPNEEARRVRWRIVFEYLALIAGFGAGWLYVEKDVFFAEGPSGVGLSGIFSVCLAALAAMVVSSLMIRNALLKNARGRAKSAPTWLGRIATAGATVSVLLLLNSEGRAEIILGGKGRAVITSNGFPFTSVWKVRLRMVPAEDSGEVSAITFPNGTQITREPGNSVTVIRFGKKYHLPANEEIQLRDGTRIFWPTARDGLWRFAIPGMPPLDLGSGNNEVKFSEGGRVVRSRLKFAFNLLIAAALLIHSDSVHRRLAGCNAA